MYAPHNFCELVELYAFFESEVDSSDVAMFTVDTAADTSDTATTDKPVYIRPAPAANLIIDIENCVKAQQNAGFTRWQKLQNLKEAAKTINFLTENNLLQYADLEAKTAEVAAAFNSIADTLNAAENDGCRALMVHFVNTNLLL